MLLMELVFYCHVQYEVKLMKASAIENPSWLGQNSYEAIVRKHNMFIYLSINIIVVFIKIICN